MTKRSTAEEDAQSVDVGLVVGLFVVELTETMIVVGVDVGSGDGDADAVENVDGVLFLAGSKSGGFLSLRVTHRLTNTIFREKDNLKQRESARKHNNVI